MIERIIDRRNLNRAFRAVTRNGGAAGVDGVSVDALARHLQWQRSTLIAAMRAGRYQASAVRGVEIPKGAGKTRLLGIPTTTDRVVQQAVQQVLGPVFEEDFCAHSYGFRPGRNAHQALRHSLAQIGAGCGHMLDIDLKSFFDEVDHATLLGLIHRKVKCTETMALLRTFLRAPMLVEGRLRRRRKGVPQGSPLSPLLSNILLNELDKELERRGHRYMRYADDFSIDVRSERAARRVGNGIFRFLRDKLRLPINHEKSGIRRPLNFQTLGHGFVSTYRKGAKGQYRLVATPKSWQRLKWKLKMLTRKTTPMSFDERKTEINAVVRGWTNYFKLASIDGKLKKVDEWLRNRLRYCIWHDWKKPDRKRKNLIRLGVPPGTAYAYSRTRMGGWRVAYSPILRTTITVARLKRRGLLFMLDHYRSIRQSIEPPYTRPVRTVV